jgi:hypothetical protein
MAEYLPPTEDLPKFNEFVFEDAYSIEGLDRRVVHKAGTETITGNKTFTGAVNIDGTFNITTDIVADKPSFDIINTSGTMLLEASDDFQIKRAGAPKISLLANDTLFQTPLLGNILFEVAGINKIAVDDTTTTLDNTTTSITTTDDLTETSTGGNITITAPSTAFLKGYLNLNAGTQILMSGFSLLANIVGFINLGSSGSISISGSSNQLTTNGTNTITSSLSGTDANLIENTGSAGGNTLRTVGGKNTIETATGRNAFITGRTADAIANLIDATGNTGGNTIRTTTGENLIQNTGGSNLMTALTTGTNTIRSANATATANLIDATTALGGNTIRTTTGTNTIQNTGGSNLMTALTTGTNTISSANTSATANLIDATSSGGGNTIRSFTGNNLIRVVGGSGSNTLSAQSGGNNITASGGGGNNTISSNGGSNTISVSSGSGNNNLTATNGSGNNITTDTGENTMSVGGVDKLNMTSTTTTLTNTNVDVVGALNVSKGANNINMIGTNVGGLYTTYFPEGTGAGRKAYIGFPNTASKSLAIVNEYTGSGTQVEIFNASVSKALFTLTQTTFANTDVFFNMGDQFTVNCFNSRINSSNFHQVNVFGNEKIFINATDTIIRNSGAIKMFFNTDEKWASYGNETYITSNNIINNAGSTFRVNLSGGEKLNIGTSNTALGNSSFVGIYCNGIVRVELYPTGNYYNFNQGGTARWRIYDNGTTNRLFVVQNNNNGVVINNGANGWSSFSDERVKKNIKPLDTELDNVLKLKPVFYNYKLDEDTQPKRVGFIAQEVKEIYPELVENCELSVGCVDNVLTIETTSMIPYLVKAIQELNKKVEEQALIINELISRTNTQN